MRQVRIQKQVHGYRRGHQLLAASVTLRDRDQDAVDRLSDLAGPLRPGELFDPYLTAYPVPSEEYYVLARTCQDLAAGRSGCVLTSSVLLPMAGWERIEGLGGVLAELVCPDRNGVAVEREVPAAKLEPPETVTDERMPELVDAVFVDRRPVVFFDCGPSEAIAVRLMLALWPAARRQFSLCTFALGPRTLDGRLSGPRTLDGRFFDLVFAPMSARSRFVGSCYRRVGGSERWAYGRDDLEYGWAGAAASRIFQSDEPGLVGWDPAGLLGSEEGGDRASLRVVSLWNELATRATENPTAVLGMLDILRSRKAKGQDGSWGDVEATVLQAIGAAAAGLPVEEGWEFLFALEGKIAGRWASRVVEKRIEAGAFELAGRDAREALAALEADPSRRLALMRVAKGLADGAAEFPDFAHLVQHVGRLPSFAVAQLMAASAGFATRVVEGMNGDDEGHWTEVFWGAFDVADEVGRRAMRRAVLRVVADDPVVERTVPRMLTGVMREEVAELARRAIQRPVPASPALNRALWDAARLTGGQAIVRDAVMESTEGAEAEQFVLPTLVLKDLDIEWLAGRTGDERRGNRLLRGLLGRVRDEDVRALSRNAAREVLALLGTDVEACKREVVRILALDVSRDDIAFDVGFQTLSVVGYEEGRNGLGEWLVRAGLSDARPDDDRVGGVLAEFGPRLPALDVVEAATASTAGAARVRANLVALNASPPDVRNRALGEVERLSEKLVGRRPEDLGGEGYSAWAAMIRDCRQGSGTEVQARVARLVLRFALRLEKVAVSALIMETFPIVYRSLPKAGKYGRIGGWGSLFYPHYLWRMGLDEREDSRKRAIKELVRAFMNSTWAPADLIVAALKAGVGKKVVRQVRERNQGVRYIDDIGRDAQRLRKDARAPVLKCLEMELSSNGSGWPEP